MICQKRDILGILYLAYIYGNKKKSEQEIVKHVCIKFTFDMKNQIFDQNFLIFLLNIIELTSEIWDFKALSNGMENYYIS